MTVPSGNKTVFAVRNIVHSLYDDTTRSFSWHSPQNTKKSRSFITQNISELLFYHIMRKDLCTQIQAITK